MTEPILQISGLRKSFGRLAAVDGVDLTVGRSEIVGVAGPNGAGKSTLINLITRVPFGPDAGEIMFEGHSLRRSSPRAICRRGLARTFQAEAAFDTLSVHDNVRLAAWYGRRVRVSRGEADVIVDRACDVVGLTAPRSTEAGLLPPIDKKRLMIASALATDPLLLCLDEPASGLIEPEQRELENIILNIRSSGVAIVVVEHVLPLLRHVADRIVIMATGKVLAEGTPDEALSDPRVVEAYIGSAP